MKSWNWFKNKCKCTRNCKCFRCKLVKLAKSWYKSLKTTTNKVFNWFKKAVLNHLPGPQLIKALVAIGGSFWLIFTGSLECTISILLLGWGAAELIDWLEWK